MISYLNIKYCYLFLLFSFFTSIQTIEYYTHPIKIVIDKANLNINNLSHKKILSYLNNSIEILSKIINTIDTPKVYITPDLLKGKCKLNKQISNMTRFTSDLIILPIFEKIRNPDNENKNFRTFLCELNPSLKRNPNIALFIINKNINMHALTNTPEKKYEFNLEIFKNLLDCLGLNFGFRIKTKQARNNYFETPLYLINNSFSYNSLLKLYKLSNKSLPKRNVNEIGLFYDPFWPEELIIKDFRSQEIDIKYDMSETSFNLLKDLNYYTLAECDMIFDNKGKCHRIDQKCITKKEFDKNYYLKYGIHNKRIICYFSDKNNLLNEQCGNKYGFLLNEVIDYSPFIKKKIVNNIKTKEIPELLNYDEIELKLFIPSRKCHSNMPRTVYFRRDYNADFFNLNDISLSEENRRFFITYEIYEDLYYNKDLLIIAQFNGFIRSFLNFGNHNLFIYKLKEEFLKENKDEIKFNKFQKISNFVGNDIFSEKDLLYNIYKNQKKKFVNDYNYMEETFIYPEEVKAINNYFYNYQIDKNNLWLVKPKNNFSGNPIHFFKSLKYESNNFIITKYITNPHLIKNRKYIIKVFALISGIKPLRIYLNNEGIIKLAIENFSLEKSSLNNKNIHITSKEEDKVFDFPVKNNKNLKNKMYFKEYKKYLKKNDINFSEIKEKINDIIIKTIISGYDYLLSKLDEYNLNDRNFFNLLGFDLLIDTNYEVHLLDVDNKPNLHIQDKGDKFIKEKIYVDTLNIVGIIPFSHDEKEEPLDDIYVYNDHIEEAVDYAFCELTRPRGNFELIFPLKNNIDKYSKFISNNKENMKLWEKIKNDDE